MSTTTRVFTIRIQRFYPVLQRFIPIALILALPILVSSSFQRNMLDIVAITAILSMSYNLVLGAAGQVSLSHNAFYAIGAYVTVICMTRLNMPMGLAFVLSMIACALAALIVGVPTLRLKSFYLAVATLALSIVNEVVLMQWRPVTGGVDGIGGFVRPALFGWKINNVAYSYIIILSAIGVYWLLENLLHSRFGRAIVAVRDHEGAAMALGVNAAWHKIAALTISAILAGFAGNLYAFRELYINPLTFRLDLAFLLLFMAIIGGLGSTAGAAIGAAVVVLLPEVMSGIGSELYFLFYGVVTILMIIFAPRGLVGILQLLYQRLVAAFLVPTIGQEAEQPLESRAEFGPLSPVRIDQPAHAILKIENITKHFGGITALENINFSVQRGSITALIGPNGAGKTTMFNVISGGFKPDNGEVHFDGQQITGIPPYLVAKRGLIRTYQIVSLFSEMTVYDNLLTGAHRLHNAGLVASALRLPRFRAEEAKVRQMANGLSSTFGLGPWRNVLASNLSFGLQRSAETARAMVAAPKLLLLDEPAAGLNEQEILGLKKTLRRMRDQGVTILLIEHNLPLVVDLSDWVVVLNFGRVLAQGTSEEIQANPEVIEAYVGTPGRSTRDVATSR